MLYCSVEGCRNCSQVTVGRDISYFSFPHDQHTCDLWIQACNSNRKLVLKNARICSIHFQELCYMDFYFMKKRFGYPVNKTRYLKPDAVPTEYLSVRRDCEPRTSSSNSSKILEA